MGLADLHIHSVYSDGTATVEAILVHASAKSGLDVIAITDHDTLEGALKARELAAHFRVDVVPGMEISTNEGHLLALFLEKPVEPGLSFIETAQQVRRYGGLPFAPHPLSRLAPSIGAHRLRALVREHPKLLAGLEAENGALLYLGENAAAQRLRWDLGLAAIGGSDAHVLNEIGTAATLFAGNTSADLRRALERGEVTPLPAQRDARYIRRQLKHFALRYGLRIIQAAEGLLEEEPRLRWKRLDD
ncbi:MAG: PHP domain-containing protein [Chloroflexi bacterium]|nr:PHP domain-containing protein [Chloroflexota bacterium]